MLVSCHLASPNLICSIFVLSQLFFSSFSHFLDYLFFCLVSHPCIMFTPCLSFFKFVSFHLFSFFSSSFLLASPFFNYCLIWSNSILSILFISSHLMLFYRLMFVSSHLMCPPCFICSMFCLVSYCPIASFFSLTSHFFSPHLFFFFPSLLLFSCLKCSIFIYSVIPVSCPLLSSILTSSHHLSFSFLLVS